MLSLGRYGTVQSIARIEMRFWAKKTLNETDFL